MHKKLLLITILILSLNQLIYSQNKNIKIDEIIIQKYKEYGIIIDLPDTHYIVDNVNQKNAKYDFAYKVPSQDVEYRMNYIEDTFLNLKNSGLSTEQILYFILQPIAANLSQQFNSPTNFNAFPTESVMHEFNTPYGLTGMVLGNSDFTGDWNYVIIEGFYKENIGFIIRYALFNDISEFTKMNFEARKAYNSFKFK